MHHHFAPLRVLLVPLTGKNLDEFLSDIEIVGIELVKIEMEFLDSPRRPDLVTAAKQIIGRDIQGIGQASKILE